jgi:uncharacterized membrane protein
VQNTRRAQQGLVAEGVREPFPFSARMVLLGLLAAMLCLVAVASVPARAYAKSYDMPKVSIKADAQSDGSLHVVEQRTFDFSGSYSAVWWVLDTPANGSLKVNGVQMGQTSQGDDGSVQLTDLPSTAFNLKWRDEGGPGTDSYSVDDGKNTVYVFFNADDSHMVVQLDYTITNGVQAYKDCADLYWKYIGSAWAEDSSDVTCTITLPVPSGATPVVGDNVRAWGHGPLDGSLAFNDTGTAVTYKVPRVAAGQYAEARVIFPVNWLTNLSADALKAHGEESHLADVLKDEQTWADQANYQRMLSLAYVIAMGVICVLLVLWAIRMFLKHGKEHKPTFTEQYWRDVPAKGMHPAVIARLWRWNKESSSDMTATLMHLAHIGAVSISKSTYSKAGAFGSKDVEDYVIQRNDAATQPASRIDSEALHFLFDVVGQGEASLRLASIKAYGKDEPEEFNAALAKWQGQVSAEVNEADYFEEKGLQCQTLVAGVAIGVAILGIILGFVTSNFWPLVFMIPTAIVLFVLSNYMTRRTQKGADDFARCEALHNWLKDFSALDERPTQDVKVWGEFMVYAYIFGVAKEVLKELRDTMPEMFAQEDSMAAGNIGYVPWYMWYAASGPVGMGSFGDVFDATVSNTMSTAQAAISAAQGVSSSGGGFGGGFSGGGGGGFGGGGGAR